MRVTPNLSYLVRGMQYRLAAALAYIAWDLGSDATPRKDSWKNNPNLAVWWPGTWRKNNERMDLKPGHTHGGGPCYIMFTNPRFDPETGDVSYGEKRVASNVEVSDDAKTKLIRNDSDSPVHVAYEESVGLTNSFSSQITHGVTLDMQQEMHAETTAEQKVSGEYMGVSAEASLSETFGVSASKSRSESEEEAKEKSEEGTSEESLSIEFEAAPGAHYLVTIAKEHATSYQPFSIHAVMDFDIHLHIPHYVGDQQHGRYHPGTDVHVVGMDGLQQFIEGFDTNYPKMEGFIHHAYSGTQAAYEWLMDPANRRVDVDGTRQASLESNASYDVDLLGAKVPDSLAHLPVVSAESVAGE